jgi:hypothetical protein
MRGLVFFLMLLVPAAAMAQCPLPITSGELYTAPVWNTCLTYLMTNASSGGGVSGSNFNATFPSTGLAIGALSGGNMVALGADAFNDLKVNLATSIPTGANVIGSVGQSGNWTVGITGVLPLPNGAATTALQGAVYNSVVQTLPSGTQQPLQLDANGNLKVNVVVGGGSSGGGGGGTSSSFGSGFPLTGTAIGAAYAGNMVSLAADASSNLNVNLKTSIPTGTNVIGSISQNGVWTFSLPANAATAANQTTVQGAVGGGTAATMSALMGGLYNSPEPTLTSGQQSALQLDSSGNLRTYVMGGITAPFASTFPATGFAIGGLSGGNLVYISADASHNLQVNCTVGCSGGTTSNASSAVATSSTNGAAVAWNYGFNGSSWDQLQVDSSKNLKVTVAAALPAGTNVVGGVTQSGTWNVTNVTGTVSLPTGAASAANQINVTGTVAAGTAASNALLTGSVYNSTQPTPTNGQQTALQADPHGNLRTSTGSVTLVALDAATVTTGGMAVNALTAGHRTAGGWLFNPVTAAASLCINEIGTASGTVSSGSTTCIAAGQTYTLAPNTGAVSVISADSSHVFSGQGFQ